MSISNTVRSAGPFLCNGAINPLPFTFKVFQTSEVVVTLIDSSGNRTTLGLTTDYTVALNANQDSNPGGTVMPLVAWATGYSIYLTSNVAATQSVTLTNTGGFYPDVINGEFDRLTILIQQVMNHQNLALSLPVGDASNTVLPSATGRASSYVGFDTFGNLAVFPTPSSTIGISYSALGALGGAALAGYTDAGANAVASTVQTELRKRTSVSGYGTEAQAIAAAGTRPLLYPDGSQLVTDSAWTPAQTTGIVGSVRPKDNAVITRSGGFGSYGLKLVNYLISAASNGAGEIDVGMTSWVTHQNLSNNNQVFGAWFGSNSPAKNLGQTYASGAPVGLEVNVGNRWADFGLQTDVGGTRYTAGFQIVPDVVPASDGINTSVVTISIASPGVVTLASHGYTAGMGVVFGGTLPTGLTAGTTYYVLSTGMTANTFQVSATPAGTAINTSGSSSGTLTVLPSYPGTFGLVISPSVHGHNWWTGILTRYDTIMPGGVARKTYGASVANNAPAAAEQFGGYFTNGIDFSGASFSNASMKFSSAQVSGTATAGGGVTVPATVNGFIVVDINGTLKKIAYFNA